MSCLNSHSSAANSGPPIALRLGGSAGSAPWMTVRTTAVSVTLRVIGPAVSWAAEIGTMPVRLTRPSVGFSPTRPLAPDGQTIEPSVSVPIATVARSAATAAPDPELDPQGLRSSAYGLLVCPPTPLQP